jgi:hypothetical protein
VRTAWGGRHRPTGRTPRLWSSSARTPRSASSSKPDGSASGWDVDAQQELTGVRYFSTALDGRFYLGAPTTEPIDVDPVFTTTKEWGNRTGHEATVSCSTTETFTTVDQTLTGFFDLTATQQDKGN